MTYDDLPAMFEKMLLLNPSTKSGIELTDFATEIDERTVVIDIGFLREYVVRIENEARELERERLQGLMEAEIQAQLYGVVKGKR